MLNLIGIGLSISQLRKEKGLTQMDIADKLFVSHQAVSNWERGETMPDIAKLPVLAEILEVSIDKILGDSKTTNIVQSLTCSEQESLKSIGNISFDELSDIAPILKSNQVDELCESLDLELTMDQILALAPYINNEIFERISNTYYEKEGIESIVALAPYLSTSWIDSIARETYLLKGMDVLVSMCPYISKDTFDDLVIDSIVKNGVSSINSVLPYVDENILNTYLEQFIKDNALFKNHLR